MPVRAVSTAARRFYNAVTALTADVGTTTRSTLARTRSPPKSSRCCSPAQGVVASCYRACPVLKKGLEFLNSLKGIFEFGAAIGITAAMLSAFATSTLAWLLKWPPWAKGASVSFLLCSLCAAWMFLRVWRRFSADRAEAAGKHEETKQDLTDRLAEIERKLAAEELKVQGLRGLLSGSLWQPEIALLFDLVIPGEQHAVTVKGPSQENAVARVTVGLRVRVMSPFAVTIKQFDFKLWCVGPGLSLGSSKLTRHTGWAPVGKYETRTYEVDVELDGSKIGFDALRDHARISIFEGTAVVASTEWTGDRTVKVEGAGHGLLYNEIPLPKPKVPNVPVAVPSLTVKARPRQI